jgi:hypothetical protein
MGNKRSDREKRQPSAGSLWRLILGIIGIVAIVQEMRKPPEERAWHGKVGGVVPYDFRKPTVDRFREAWWNPEGPLVSAKAFGVGWVLNLGALKKRVGR